MNNKKNLVTLLILSFILLLLGPCTFFILDYLKSNEFENGKIHQKKITKIYPIFKGEIDGKETTLALIFIEGKVFKKLSISKGKTIYYETVSLSPIEKTRHLKVLKNGKEISLKEELIKCQTEYQKLCEKIVKIKKITIHNK